MKTLSLALALRRIKDLKHQISEVDSRLSLSTVWEKDKPPAWSMIELLEKRALLVPQLTQLKSAVAEANATTHLTFQGQDIPLTSAVNTLSELKGMIALIKALPTLPTKEVVEREVEWEPDEHDYSKRVRIEKVTTHCCALTTRERAERVEKIEQMFSSLNEVVEDLNHKTTIRTSE